MKVYGGWANDEQTRIDAASGGGICWTSTEFFSIYTKKIK